MDSRLRELERKAKTDPEANLQLQTLQIKSGQWNVPENKFAGDIQGLRDFLSLNLPQWHTELYAKLEEPDSNKDETVIKYGWWIFTHKEVNSPNSFIYSDFLVALDLLYPTKKGVIELQLITQYYLARPVVAEGHPFTDLADKIADLINNYFGYNDKTPLTLTELRNFDNNIKLKSAPCIYCSATVSWSREFDNEHLPERKILWERSGQTETSDDYAGYSFLDPNTEEKLVVCFRCNN